MSSDFLCCSLYSSCIMVACLMHMWLVCNLRSSAFIYHFSSPLDCALAMCILNDAMHQLFIPYRVFCCNIAEAFAELCQLYFWTLGVRCQFETINVLLENSSLRHLPCAAAQLVSKCATYFSFTLPMFVFIDIFL